MTTAAHRGGDAAGSQQRRRPRPHTPPGELEALDAREPPEPGEAEGARDVEVQPQSEEAVSGIDAKQLLTDTRERVAGDVQREETRRADPPAPAEPDEHGGQREVPQQLVEERRVEGGKALKAGGPVGRVDLESPREARGASEELLVEVVAHATDGLGDEQAGGGGVHEGDGVGVAAAQHPQPGECPAGDAAPDAEAALPDRNRPPPMVRHLVPARRQVVEAPADQPRRKAPQGDLVHEVALTAAALPAARRQGDRRGHGDDVRQAIGVHEDRAEVKAVRRRAGEECDHGTGSVYTP